MPGCVIGFGSAVDSGGWRVRRGPGPWIGAAAFVDCIGHSVTESSVATQAQLMPPFFLPGACAIFIHLYNDSFQGLNFQTESTYWDERALGI